MKRKSKVNTPGTVPEVPDTRDTGSAPVSLRELLAQRVGPDGVVMMTQYGHKITNPVICRTVDEVVAVNNSAIATAPLVTQLQKNLARPNAGAPRTNDEIADQAIAANKRGIKYRIFAEQNDMDVENLKQIVKRRRAFLRRPNKSK